MPQNWIKWSNSEDEFIRNNYEKLTVKEISEKLGRTNKATRARIERLGLKLAHLKRIQAYVWTKYDIDYLKQNYLILTDKEISIMIFGDDDQSNSSRVFRKRHSLGLKKPRRGLKYNHQNKCEYTSRYFNGEKIYQHIKNAEKKIGRKLKKGEIVHHIDGNKRNNNPNNLAILNSKSEHKLLHSQLEKTAFKLIKNGTINFNEKTKKYEICANLNRRLKVKD